MSPPDEQGVIRNAVLSHEVLNQTRAFMIFTGNVAPSRPVSIFPLDEVIETVGGVVRRKLPVTRFDRAELGRNILYRQYTTDGGM